MPNTTQKKLQNNKPDSKLGFKLSKRLQQLTAMVTFQYDHIWDCCCDHGLLGFALLSRNLINKAPQPIVPHVNNTIHFVDIVPELITTVQHKLKRFYPHSNWQTYCLDVAKLPLRQYQGRHLVIIAGVGSDLMIEFIKAIVQQHKDLNIDFLLCPVHHQFALREQLIALNFSLKDEVLIEENRRFYEILLVSSWSDSASEKPNKVSPVGDKIWQTSSSQQREIAQKYLHKSLSHYQRIQQGAKQNKANNVQHIIDAYRDITLTQ